MTTEAAENTDFSAIRYAQVWEDADVLMAALNPGSEDICLSIASAGDNALALLAGNPKKVIALDLNAAQLACLELRVAAIRNLDYQQVLQLIGSRTCHTRTTLYSRCKSDLSPQAEAFWEAHRHLIEQGIGAAGKFERYFKKFRCWVLPLIHSRRNVAALLSPKSDAERIGFYDRVWSNRRWSLLFRLFFSRTAMGLLGRDPAFFKYVTKDVAVEILNRTRYALTRLDPAQNPYLHWILLGTHQRALPFYLCPENYQRIKANLAKLEWHQASIEKFLEHYQGEPINCWNLSDIFEYMSERNYEILLDRIISSSASGARLAYWNMLVPRSAPAAFHSRIKCLSGVSESLHQQDRAFFYSRFIVEEVL